MPEFEDNPSRRDDQGQFFKSIENEPFLDNLHSNWAVSIGVNYPGYQLATMPSNVIRLLRPPRKIRSNPRSSTGWTYLFSQGKSVAFESQLECDLLERLDMDPHSSRIRTQELCLQYEHEGKTHVYNPDIELECNPALIQSLPFNLHAVVVEVKYEVDLQKKCAELAPRFAAAYLYCLASGRQFYVLTETRIRTPILVNSKQYRKYLRGYVDPSIRRLLLGSLQEEGESSIERLISYVLEAIQVQRADIVDTLYALMAKGEIQFDQNEIVTKKSPLWLARSLS